MAYKNVDPINVEVLRLARDLVINEYTDRRAELHNKWLAESDMLWRTKKVRLQYPSIPPYPTEAEIVTRAQTLMDFLHKKHSPQAEEDPPPVVQDPVVETLPAVEEQPPAPTIDAIVEQEPIEEVKPVVEDKPVEEIKPTPVEEPTVEPAVEESKPLMKVYDPEEFEEYSYLKSRSKLEEESSSTSRLIPSLVKQIEKIRSNLR